MRGVKGRAATGSRVAMETGHKIIREEGWQEQQCRRLSPWSLPGAATWPCTSASSHDHGDEEAKTIKLSFAGKPYSPTESFSLISSFVILRR